MVEGAQLSVVTGSLEVYLLSDLDLFGVGGRIISGVFLIPYVGWGIHTLRLRLRYHEDLPPSVEVFTLAGVTLFYIVEMFLLHAYLRRMPVLYAFAILGLFVSGAALYGPMAISLLSQLMVDSVMPKERSKTHEPNYAPAYALERQSDFEGALREYMVIARIFPKDPTPITHIAELEVHLSHPAEAARWFERAFDMLDSEEKCLHVVNRLYQLYVRELDNKAAAEAAMNRYLSRFPNAAHGESMRLRIERLRPSG